VAQNRTLPGLESGKKRSEVQLGSFCRRQGEPQAKEKPEKDVEELVVVEVGLEKRRASSRIIEISYNLKPAIAG